MLISYGYIITPESRQNDKEVPALGYTYKVISIQKGAKFMHYGKRVEKPYGSQVDKEN